MMSSTIPVKEKEVISIEKPKTLTKKNVIYWSEHYKELQGVEGNNAILTKAKKFLAEDCIEWDRDDKIWKCKPIKDYNRTTYRIESKNNQFHCSCQFHCKTGRTCSHILALYLFLKIMNWNKYGD